MGNNNSKGSKDEKVSKGKGSNSASTATKQNDTCQLTDKEIGKAMTMSQNVEKKCCGNSMFDSSIEHSMDDADVHSGIPKTDVCSEMFAVDIRNDLKKMLLDLLQNDSEVELVYIKPNFKARYGYALDNKVLGHPSLLSLLSSLEDVTVIGRHDKKVVLRSSECASDKRESNSQPCQCIDYPAKLAIMSEV
ncbi:hypothetical protein GOP47_0023055 [Adiantum capillus-veneris]|uniref:HTH OST-type domain-containing protein n=1 Tax=Adiantum capillus-veneris TaxID=13818 RepID=A0A9D4Z7H0_ADICA|nr:hypothetical protein GOP47_0023055 [Adiantum capillus-veneris]